MLLDFVRNFVGTVGSGLDFVVVITACVLLVVISSLIIGFFLSALSCLTHRFFR